ncbi:PREDICTED: translation initiation factor IF-2-like, partial [Chinchilla lanigera]|uniref:translation initiation factor IF-2-like n=1 Tax=Chinchilla lanigera TaxID=34839 RepID=UPI000697B5F4
MRESHARPTPASREKKGRLFTASRPGAGVGGPGTARPQILSAVLGWRGGSRPRPFHLAAQAGILRGGLLPSQEEGRGYPGRIQRGLEVRRGRGGSVEKTGAATRPSRPALRGASSPHPPFRPPGEGEGRLPAPAPAWGRVRPARPRAGPGLAERAAPRAG